VGGADHVVGAMLLITDMRYNAVDVVTTAQLTQAAPIDHLATAAATANADLTDDVWFWTVRIAVYVTQT